jgi:hypothetical protein
MTLLRIVACAWHRELQFGELAPSTERTAVMRKLDHSQKCQIIPQSLQTNVLQFDFHSGVRFASNAVTLYVRCHTSARSARHDCYVLQ